MHIAWHASVLKSLLVFNAAERNKTRLGAGAERNTQHQTPSSREVPNPKHQTQKTAVHNRKERKGSQKGELEPRGVSTVR